MLRSKQHLHSITSSARASSVGRHLDEMIRGFITIEGFPEDRRMPHRQTEDAAKRLRERALRTMIGRGTGRPIGSGASR